MSQHFDAREARSAGTQAAVGIVAQALIVALIFALAGLWASRPRADELDQRYPSLSAPPLEKKPAVARGRNRSDEACLPWSIKGALTQVRAMCGDIKVISTWRPGAHIPTGQISLHATCEAADFTPRSCDCAYRALSGWQYGLSLDCRRMRHIHISVPGPRNEGRFYHSGGKRKKIQKHEGTRSEFRNERAVSSVDATRNRIAALARQGRGHRAPGDVARPNAPERARALADATDRRVVSEISLRRSAIGRGVFQPHGRGNAPRSTLSFPPRRDSGAYFSLQQTGAS